MTTSTIATLIAVTCLLGITAIVFYKTIITREWRDRAPRERESWYLGIFYYNPADARMLVPKRTGLGWTVNFGRPLAVVLTLLLAAALIALGVAMQSGAA